MLCLAGQVRVQAALCESSSSESSGKCSFLLSALTSEGRAA